jgi:hypothetical protein
MINTNLSLNTRNLHKNSTINRTTNQTIIDNNININQNYLLNNTNRNL